MKKEKITDKKRLDWLVRNGGRWVDGKGSFGSSVPILRKELDKHIRAHRRDNKL